MNISENKHSSLDSANRWSYNTVRTKEMKGNGKKFNESASGSFPEKVSSVSHRAVVDGNWNPEIFSTSTTVTHRFDPMRTGSPKSTANLSPPAGCHGRAEEGASRRTARRGSAGADPI